MLIEFIGCAFRVALLIIETLSMMLRESEIFSTRMLILKNNNGSTLKQLIVSLVTTARGYGEHERNEVEVQSNKFSVFKAKKEIMLFPVTCMYEIRSVGVFFSFLFF